MGPGETSPFCNGISLSKDIIEDPMKVHTLTGFVPRYIFIPSNGQEVRRVDEILGKGKESHINEKNG